MSIETPERPFSRLIVPPAAVKEPLSVYFVPASRPSRIMLELEISIAPSFPTSIFPLPHLAIAASQPASTFDIIVNACFPAPADQPSAPVYVNSTENFPSFKGTS